MSAKFKVNIKQQSKSWVVITLSQKYNLFIIEASEIACNPVGDLISAVENSGIYNHPAQVVFDAEGNLYRLKFELDSNGIITRGYFVEHHRSIEKPNNSEYRETLEFEVFCEKNEFIKSYWRGLKSYFNEENLNSDELLVIEKAVIGKS